MATTKVMTKSDVEAPQKQSDIYKTLSMTTLADIPDTHLITRVFLSKNAPLVKDNPIGWMNQFLQDTVVCNAHGFEQSLNEVVDKKFHHSGMDYKMTLTIRRNGYPIRTIAKGHVRRDYRREAYFHLVQHVLGVIERTLNKQVDAQMKRGRKARRNLARKLFFKQRRQVTKQGDAQMDSTQSSETGPSTLEGEKSFATIMTADVPKVSTLPYFPSESEIMNMTKMATGEEVADFDVLQSRWTRLRTFDWTPDDQTQGRIIYKALLPEEFYNNTSAPNRLPFEQFVYTRPSYEIKVKVNGHKFAQGRLMVTYYYEPGTTGLNPPENTTPDYTAGPWYWQNGVMRDHAYIDLSESNEVEMSIPFRNKSIWINTLPNSGTALQGAVNVVILIYQISPISVGMDSPTSFPITVYARLHDTKFTGIRNHKSVDGQMGQAVVKGAMEVGKTIMTGVGYIPVVGDIVKPVVGAVANGALNIVKAVSTPEHIKTVEARLRYAGMIPNRDKPILNEQPRELRPNVVGNLAIATEVEPCFSMRLDPAATTCLPQQLDFQLPNDSIYDMLHVWNYFTKFTWNMSNLAGSQLMTTPGSPFDQLSILNSETVGATLIDGLNQYYAYNAGGIEYRFDVVCTQFHNGILVVTWVPWATDYTLEEGMSSYYKIFDLREDKTFNFSIPYINNTLFRNSPYQSVIKDYGLGPFNPGNIKVWVQNPLIPIQSVPSQVEVLVFKRVMPDFQVSCLKKHSYETTKNFFYQEELLRLDGNYPIGYSEGEKVIDMSTADMNFTSLGQTIERAVRNFLELDNVRVLVNDDKIAMAELLENRLYVKSVSRGSTYVTVSATGAQSVIIQINVDVPVGSIPIEADIRPFAVNDFNKTATRQIYNYRDLTDVTVVTDTSGFIFVNYNANTGLITLTTQNKEVGPVGIWIDAANATERVHVNGAVTDIAHDDDVLADAQMDTGDKETTDNTPVFGTIIPIAQVIQVGEDHSRISNIMKRYVWVDEQQSKPLEGYSSDPKGFHLVPFTITPWQYYQRTTVVSSLQAYLARQFRWGRGSLRVLILISDNDDKNVVITHIPQNSVSKVNTRGDNYYFSPFLNGNSYASQYINTEINPTVKLEIPFHGIYNYLDMQAGLGNLTYQQQLPSYMDLIAINLGMLTLTSPGKFRARFWLSAGDDWTFHQFSPMAFQYNQLYTVPTARPSLMDLTYQHARQVHADEQRLADAQMMSEEQDEPQPSTSTFPDDVTFGIVGPTDATLPQTRLQGFSSSAMKGVSRALDSVTTPIKHAIQLPSRVANTFKVYEKLGEKIDSAYESIKDMAQSIMNMVTSQCSWIISNTGAIFSSIVHFLQILVNPKWETFVLSFLGMLSSFQLFCQGTMSKLTDFFLSMKNKTPPTDQQTGDQAADAQCEHNTCDRCKNREQCMKSCKYCAPLMERDYLFSDEEASNLVAILVAGLSSYWQYKGIPPDTSTCLKALKISSTFWMTARGAVGFLKIIIRIIRRIVTHFQYNSADTLAAKLVTEESESIVSFIKEANFMMDQRNLIAMQTDPTIKHRFWCCVAKAYQLQEVLISTDVPNRTTIHRICKQIIDIGNKEAVHAMSCPVRYEPYVLCLEGATKIGKSYMAQDFIPEALSDPNVYNIKSYDNPIFVRTPGVEFWNGYRNQPCILYDDFLAVNSAEFAPRQVVELFNLKSSAIMNMNMANLEEKALRGNPFLVTLCANNAFTVVNGTTDPAAFLRRKDAVWKVCMDQKYKSVHDVPLDIKKNFGHLFFYRYADSANSESLGRKKHTYEEWKRIVKSDMSEYHRREMKNVARRMERLQLLLPETAKVMMSEVDPYHIFYSAYMQASDEHGLIQTGLLPSEMIAKQLEITALLMPKPEAVKTDQQSRLVTVYRPDEPQPSTSTADAQIDFRNIWEKFRNLLYDKLYYRNYGPYGPVDVASIQEGECRICNETVELAFTCRFGHQVCRTCRQGQVTASLDSEQIATCAICRNEVYDIRIHPEYYADHFVGLLYFNKIRSRCKTLTAKISEFYSSILRDPYWQKTLAIALSVLAAGSALSVTTFVAAHIQQGTNNTMELDHLKLCPSSMIYTSRVKSWGPFFRCEDEKEALGDYKRRIATLIDEYNEDEERERRNNEFLKRWADSQITPPEVWPHLTQPISKDLVRGPTKKDVRQVANVTCPHKTLNPRDAQYDTDERLGWFATYLDTDVIHDAPCQFSDCPWLDPNKRHEFLNNWAHEHEITILGQRRHFNRNSGLIWTLPDEYLPQETSEIADKKLDDIRTKIRQAALGKTWSDYLPKWMTWRNIFRVAKYVIAGITTCLATYSFFKWAQGDQKEDAQIINSGSYPMKRLPHKKIEAKGVAQFSSDKYNATIRLIERNSACFIVKYNVGEREEKRYLRLVGLFGRLCMLPKHFGLWLETWLSRVKRGDYTNASITLVSYKYPDIAISWEMERGKIRYTDNDLAFIELPMTFPLFKDITSFVATKEQHSMIAGEIRHVEVDHRDHSVRIKDSAIRDRASTLKIKGTADYQQYEAYNIYETVYGREGACGAIYLSRMDQPIFGLHIAGDNLNCDVGYGVALIREDMEALKKQHVSFQSWHPNLKDPGDAQMAMPGCIVPLGTLPKEQISFCPTTSKIIPSLLQGKIKDIPTLTQPGILSSQDERYQYNRSPLYWGCMKHTKPAKDFTKRIFEMAAEGVEADIIEAALPLRDVSRTLTIEEAITGFNDLPHYDMLNLQTSAGWPWNLDNDKKTKEGWIRVDRDKHGQVQSVEVHERLKAVMELKDKQRVEGIKPFTGFLDWLKDERRKASKLALCDGTRVFSLSPLDFSIQQRQMFLDFSASFMFYRQRMEHAVGINPDGPEWSNLAYQMNQKSSVIFDGDYKDFGPRLLAMVVHKAYDIMIEWYRKNGDTSKDNARRRKIMAEEVANCVHVSRDFVYEGLCGSPSGSTLTTIVNTIASMLYIRFCWFAKFWSTEHANHRSYKENVLLKAYGDDMFAAVKPEFKDLFNTLEIGKILAKHDIVFTDATKQGLIPYQTLNEVTFLKRRFVRHPTREGEWLAPLEELSVHECAQWVWKSPDLKEATQQNAEQSLMLAYGHGPEYFDAWKRKLNDALDRIRLPRLALTWSSLDDMHFGTQEIEGGFFSSENSNEISREPGVQKAISERTIYGIGLMTADKSNRPEDTDKATNISE